MTALYTDRLSVRPGETFQVHASAKGLCQLEIARVGRNRVVVQTHVDIATAEYPIPTTADAEGCGWPSCLTVTVGDWASGYYDLLLTDADGQSARHFVCVRPAKGQTGSRAAIVLATNTYHSYNWWGGANAYSDVTSLMTGRKSFADAMDDAIGVLSTQRPFIPLIVGAPDDAPRLINLRKRGFEEQPFAADYDWMIANGCSPYDGSAGFLNKWEHRFVEWAEGEGYALDYHTDYDLDAEDDVLKDYSCALFVGHSEYWSGRERDQIERLSLIHI